MRGSHLIGAALLFFFGAVTAEAQYTLKTLVTFDGTNGAGPLSGLVADHDGNLYGATGSGGANGAGSVFKIAVGTHEFTTVASFVDAGPQCSLLLDGNGNFYGTTTGGGPSEAGTVFEIAAGSHVVTTLATFNGTNGANPIAGLIADANGNLYGTTQFGGAFGSYGTVFELAAGTHSITTIVSFNGMNGEYPHAGLAADSRGNLYGTTTNYGTLFKISAETHELTTLANFYGTDGVNPQSTMIIDGEGNLFGTTPQGPTSAQGGMVFRVPAGTNTIETLATFTTFQGKYGPLGGVIMDASGNLFGMTSYGGAYDMGSIYEIVAGTHEPITLVSFDGMNGFSPQLNSLVADANGNLYGTVPFGGDFNNGLVFELSPVSEPTTLSLLSFGLLGCLILRRRLV